MLATTLMQPVPPWALKPSALASSPESWRKSSPQAMRWSDARLTSPVASLTPMIRGRRLSSPMVAGVMSITDRPGML